MHGPHQGRIGGCGYSWSGDRIVNHFPLAKSVELSLHVSSSRKVVLAVELGEGGECVTGTICLWERLGCGGNRLVRVLSSGLTNRLSECLSGHRDSMMGRRRCRPHQ